MNYELSVIIPTFRRQGSLKKLLEILLNQTGISIEIIVVDQNANGYFDADIVTLLHNVKTIKQAHPNVSDARNRGFLNSSAPYLLFLDDDLIPDSNFCRDGVNVFLNYPDIKSFSPLVYNDAGMEVAFRAAKKKYLAYYNGTDGIFSITDTISAAIFFKREAYLNTGGFDNLLFEFAKTAEDQEFFLRMLRKEMTHWFVGGVKVYHDEKIPGGCDLRTDDYWITREKCMKAWALRYRTYDASGKIGPRHLFELFRSCVLNLEVLTSSPKYIKRQFLLMVHAIKKSRLFFDEKRSEYNLRMNQGFLQ